MRPNGKWRLCLQPFELTSPDGFPVRFSYAKVEALLRILATQRGPIDRNELGLVLWPEASVSQRRVNLRQALYQLRNALGSDRVLADRVGCRLSDEIELDFEIRGLVESEEEVQPQKGNGPVEAFLQLIQWYAEWDPGQMLEIMRANRHLACGVMPKDATRVIELAAKTLKLNHPLAAWLPFWRGYQLCNAQQLAEARRLFRHAVERGTECMDSVLTVESLFWMGVCDILLKRVDAASRAAEFGKGYVAALNDRTLSASVDNLRAHILIHQTRTREGIDLLGEVSHQLEDSILDRAQNEALIALYHACSGNSKAAMQTLEWPAMVGEDTHHFRLNAICDLALGYVAVREGELDRALRLMERVSKLGQNAESGHFQIYAHEGAAMALWRLTERPDAIEHLRSAKKIRANMSMAYTEWDQMRMRPVLPAVRSA